MGSKCGSCGCFGVSPHVCFSSFFAPPLPPVTDQMILIAHASINVRNKLPSSFGPPRTHLILLRMDRLWLVVLRRVRRRKLRRKRMAQRVCGKGKGVWAASIGDKPDGRIVG